MTESLNEKTVWEATVDFAFGELQTILSTPYELSACAEAEN